ncbi:MAG TPA: class I SAM-dependent RNA methyltransferase, partial [Bacteroidetes bacterium]|nr:class I SAM-dependent RNA methyltransferase [Bacteroidota bacterium]
MKFVAKTLMGLENVLAKEIENLGGNNIEIVKRAVVFNGDIELMYKANLFLRSALRILVFIKKFDAKSPEELYEKTKSLNWTEFIGLNQTFAIDATVNSSIFTHSKFITYKVKDAIVDFYYEKYGRRPNISTYKPEIKINVRISEDQIELSLDSSGESLHKRGYKVESLDAPLSEVLAAGILLNTEFQNFENFLDPMCGSGTLLTEALMINTNFPANILREDFGFMTWNNFNNRLWKEIKEEALTQVHEPTIDFYAFDKNRKAIFATKKNLSMLKYGNRIKVDHKDFFKLKNCERFDFIIMNPPYDIRLKDDEILSFYTNIGDKLKQDCAPCIAWIFSGNIKAL